VVCWNVWCGSMKDRIIGPFFFVEATVTGDVYPDVLEQFMYPQVADFQLNIIYQQDGACSLESGVCTFEKLSREPSRIIGLGAADQSLGPRVRRISFRWISFSGGTSRTECMLPVRLTTRPHPWCDCLRNPGHVGQNMARNWVQTWHYSCHQWVTCWSVLN
jgi:hypothetical protein